MGVGVCGGLTTFSGLAVDIAWRLDAGELGGATLMIGASLVLGLSAFLSGREVAS